MMHSTDGRGIITAVTALVPALVIGTSAASMAHRPETTVAGTPADIPAFARQYRTACSTCHIAAPKLNVLGEAFRLNGYRMPAANLLIRRDDPVPLGDDAWKDQWPRAIWPGQIPGQAPIALRIQSDLHATNDSRSDARVSFHFPHEMYLLAGTTLGPSISAFIETEWSRADNLQVVQAKLAFQDPISSLPEGLLNVWVGMQNPYLITFADRQIDRAGRQKFRWQEFAAPDLVIVHQTTQDTLAATNAYQLGGTQPSIEINGLLSSRLHYGLGVSQGAGNLNTDNNQRKDLYYRVRFKVGGMDYRGAYRPGTGPVLGTGGQLLDRSLTVEHFAYFGSEPASDASEDRHWSVGAVARLLQGPLDAGIGVVRRRHERPWGVQTPGTLTMTSVFGKVEYLAMPWLIGSVKLESFRTHLSADTRALGFTNGGDVQQIRATPGLIALLRQNVRGVVEAEWIARDRVGGLANPAQSPFNLWLRLDVAF